MEEKQIVLNEENNNEIKIVESEALSTEKRKTKVKKVLLIICIIIISLICAFIGRYLYNNGNVTNRAITLNIDLRDIKGKYTGTIKDGLPNGNGIFVYDAGYRDIKFDGFFSNGKFVSGKGVLRDNQNNIVYNGNFNNGLPDKNIFSERCKSVTGLALGEWVKNENLYKCYQQIGTIIQVNGWAEKENGVCLTVVTGGNNNGKAIRVFFENNENIDFRKGNLVNWLGRLTYVTDVDDYPEVIAYYVKSFTEEQMRQYLYNSLTGVVQNNGFAIEF